MKNTLKTNFFTVKPKYVRNSQLPPCHVIDKIQEELSKKTVIEGLTEGNDAVLKVDGREACFWSPEFNVHVTKRGKGSTIRGTLGPNTGLKTMLNLLASMALVLLFLGLLMIIYQWIFGMQSPLVWSAPLGLIFMLIAFVMAKIMLFKSKHQMVLLWNFIEDAVDIREKKQKKLLDEMFPDEEVII